VGTQHPAVSDAHPVVSAQSQLRTCEEEEEEEHLFVFNDTIEGLRAPAIKQGRAGWGYPSDPNKLRLRLHGPPLCTSNMTT
jgi:hypothetical protein